MRYRRLGRSGLRVSSVSLGTMTFGGTLDDRASFPLLDCAVDGGINFLDLSEMADGLAKNVRVTYGTSEALLGRWLKRRRGRDALIITTKVCGPNEAVGNLVPHIRSSNTALDRFHIERALDGSLKRLGTDYVDLYQLHWPDRAIPMVEQLECLARLIEAGKVRYAGVSNETPWGLTRFVALAETTGLPCMVSLQNVYNLLDRGFEASMQEVCVREDVGLMAFSPLAMGVLTGKYSGGVLPRGSRLSRFSRYRPRWGTERHLTAADRYAGLARAAGLDPARMALAWVRERPGVATVLSSCRTLAQLDSLVASAELDLPAELNAALDAVRAD